MDFKRELKERTENIEKILAVFAPEEQGFQKTIFQAMNYSLMAGASGCGLCLFRKPTGCSAAAMRQ